MTLNCSECMKIEFQKIENLIDTTADDKDLSRFASKNGLKFGLKLTKKLELKH